MLNFEVCAYLSKVKAKIPDFDRWKASRRGIPNFFDDSVPLGN